MKKYFFTALALLSVISLQAQDDKAQIKSVIEQETNAFYSVDSISWKSYWLNAPYTYWAYSDAKGGTFVEGTPNIQKNFKEYFKTAKPAANSKIERTWTDIRVYGTGAYVHFNQKVSDGIDSEETSEVRVLEKDKGKWKIVCMSAYSKSQTKK